MLCSLALATRNLDHVLAAVFGLWDVVFPEGRHISIGGMLPNIIARMPFAKVRRSLANLIRTASTRLRAVVTSASKSPVSSAGQRPSVVLVHPDRLARASMARALVNARFDVDAFDLPSQVLPTVRSRKGAVIVVVDVKEDDVESILQALVMANPALHVLAWGDASPVIAETILKTAGIQKFAVISKAASPTELVEKARQLVLDVSREA